MNSNNSNLQEELEKVRVIEGKISMKTNWMGKEKGSSYQEFRIIEGVFQ